MLKRLLPPTGVGYQTMTVNGRTYGAAPGAVLDVVDTDADILGSNGWTVVAFSGPTSARPSGTLPPYPATQGLRYLDTTISKLIIFDGATWRDPATGAAV